MKCEMTRRWVRAATTVAVCCWVSVSVAEEPYSVHQDVGIQQGGYSLAVSAQGVSKAVAEIAGVVIAVPAAVAELSGATSSALLDYAAAPIAIGRTHKDAASPNEQPDAPAAALPIDDAVYSVGRAPNQILR